MLAASRWPKGLYCEFTRPMPCHWVMRRSWPLLHRAAWLLGLNLCLKSRPLRSTWVCSPLFSSWFWHLCLHGRVLMFVLAAILQFAFQQVRGFLQAILLAQCLSAYSKWNCLSCGQWKRVTPVPCDCQKEPLFGAAGCIFCKFLFVFFLSTFFSPLNTEDFNLKEDGKIFFWQFLFCSIRESLVQWG